VNYDAVVEMVIKSVVNGGKMAIKVMTKCWEP